MDKIRGENWTFSLYDTEEDNKKYEYIIKNYNYASIWHEKDINEETGEIKKKHRHVVIMLENARTLKSIAEELQIDKNDVQKVKSIKYMVRYLIHKDNPEKHQYNKEEIESNVEDIVNKYINTETGEEEIIMEIINYIDTFKRPIYYREVLNYVLKNKYYSIYRRGINVLNRIIQEHNEQFTKFLKAR